MYEKIQTERLILKRVSLADAEFIQKLYNGAKFIEFIGDKGIRTVEDAQNYIEKRFLPQIEKLGFGNYIIIRKEDERKVGSVGIFERDGLDVHDIGFSFLPEFEAKGYGFEAASALIHVSFTEFGLQKISAITSNANISSQKLIEKLGLKYLKNIQLPNDDEELRYYEIDNKSKKETH